MTEQLRFLIIDGYSRESRDKLEEAGMKLAWKLYAEMLQQHLPEAVFDVLLPTDNPADMPRMQEMETYSAIIWTGCNLSIYDTQDPSVSVQIRLAQEAYEVGVPSFGSCWGIQMAAVAAGGEVKPNPKGREMGLARKIYLTPEASDHKMFTGRSGAFEGFISHDDMITRLPAGAVVLAANSFTPVQALAVQYKNGTFWATQYHPEYNLHEMARLIVAREEKLIRAGFFRNHDDLVALVERMEALYQEPNRKDLRWQLAIDDDVMKDEVRQNEFINWLNFVVLPGKTSRQG